MTHRDRPQDLKGGEGAAGGVSNTDLTIENKSEQTGTDRAQTPVFRAYLGSFTTDLRIFLNFVPFGEMISA